MDLKEAGLLTDTVADHWYYRAKSAALMAALGPLLPVSVLDVGAGCGFFSRQLLKQPQITGIVCVDPGYDGDHDERIGGKTLQFRRTVGRNAADVVLMMDVLEHVDDDAGLLAAYAGAASPGTRFVVTVPAFNWLWSDHDVFLGHHRRYTLGQLRRLAERAGLVTDRAHYFYGLLFPLAAVSRLANALMRRLHHGAAARSQMRPLGALLNAILWSVCRLELLVARHNRLLGLTAMIVARKPS